MPNLNGILFGVKGVFWNVFPGNCWFLCWLSFLLHKYCVRELWQVPELTFLWWFVHFLSLVVSFWKKFTSFKTIPRAISRVSTPYNLTIINKSSGRFYRNTFITVLVKSQYRTYCDFTSTKIRVFDSIYLCNQRTSNMSYSIAEV